jgi:hypothetical protein
MSLASVPFAVAVETVVGIAAVCCAVAGTILPTTVFCRQQYFADNSILPPESIDRTTENALQKLSPRKYFTKYSPETLSEEILHKILSRNYSA